MFVAANLLIAMVGFVVLYRAGKTNLQKRGEQEFRVGTNPETPLVPDNL